MKAKSSKARRKKLDFDTQAIFCRQLAFVVKAGIPLSDACEYLASESGGPGRPGALDEVFSKARGGENFTQSLKESGLFSDYLVSVVELGEKTGNLENVLYDLADYFEQRSSIRRKIIEAFTYPAILLVMMAAVILFLIVEVLPQFAAIISGAGGSLPGAAQAILNFGLWVRDDWPYILTVVVIVIAALCFLGHSPVGRRAADRFLFAGAGLGGTMRMFSTARFCQAMRMALACGNSFPSSVELTAGVVSNSEVQKRLRRLRDLVEGGEEIPDAMGNVNLFPVSFVKLFSTAYKTGNLEETLERMASYYQESFDDSVYAITSRIEPALVIILSCVAGVILFSVMIPIINIMQLIG